jgi:hypothetical protein
VQVIADPFGRLLWASAALPGSVHDIRAARTHGIVDALAQADIRCWADKAYQCDVVPSVRVIHSSAQPFSCSSTSPSARPLSVSAYSTRTGCSL